VRAPTGIGAGRAPPDVESSADVPRPLEETELDAHATVEEYFAALPERSRAALDEIRRTIRAAAPDATECISYAMPAFEDHGRILVYYAAFTNHYSLFPGSKASIADLGEEAAAHATGKGTLQFRYDEPVPTGLVTRIVEIRLAENAAARQKR
jgi:uncharacterized protein YdhG (YjbR/CyaY superfamily)